MKPNQNKQYYLIVEAITYIELHHKNQLSLNEVANAIGLNSKHFQKLFTDWAGINPKLFLQFFNLQHVKKLLQKPQQTLFSNAYELGLSKTGRLHNLFVKIEEMTPEEYKNKGESLTIYYFNYSSPFGDVIIANTHKGISHIAFTDNLEKDIIYLKKQLPNASYINKSHIMQTEAITSLNHSQKSTTKLNLHIKGTSFQFKVWKALLNIPLGKLTSYGDIAKQIHQPNASRAVGTAIGKNPIAYLIPCHRVINATGIIGNYMWGSIRKKAIIGWEFAKTKNI